MSPTRMIGMLLIVLGIAAFAYEGITYRSRSEAFHLGNLHVPLPPVAGALAIGVGIFLIVMDVKKLVPAGARS